jgi:hypothetical protein
MSTDTTEADHGKLLLVDVEQVVPRLLLLGTIERYRTNSQYSSNCGKDLNLTDFLPHLVKMRCNTGTKDGLKQLRSQSTIDGRSVPEGVWTGWISPFRGVQTALAHSHRSGIKFDSKVIQRI